MADVIFKLSRLIIGFFLCIPLIILIAVFEAMNKKGNFSTTVEELKNLLSWLIPGM